MAFPANTISCDPALVTGNEDGSTWEDAYRSIQDAIDACSGSPNIIWVKARTETISAQIDVDQACTLYGGFDNALTTDSGSILGRSPTSRTTIDGGDTYRIADFTESATFDAFEFVDGSATRGAACYSNAGDDGTFVNCVFDGNNATEYSAIYWNTYSGSTLTITDCLFTDNAGANGGAIALRGGVDLVCSNSIFGGSDGTKNVAESGACIYAVTGSSATCTDCVFDSNDATGGANDGGVFNENSSGATHTFTRCKFTENWADDDGGVMYLQAGTTNLISCLLAGNDADDDGGALEVYSGSTCSIKNCTFAGNTAIDGSAIKGGGTCTIINSCFWDNTGDDDLSGSFTVTYSNVEGGYTGTGNINVDPNFTGSGDEPYQPDTTSDMITEGSNGDMTADDILGDSWLDDTMGCYNLYGVEEEGMNTSMMLFNF